MRYPVNYIAITKDFKKGSHYGIDLGWNSKNGGKNQPIYACEDGKIIYKQVQKSGGKVLHIKHSNGYVSEYAHLDTWFVNKGDKVKMGQKIGTMGRTGSNCNGNHLHFGLYKGTKINYNKRGKFVNPLSVLKKTDDQNVGKNTSKNYNIKEFPIKQVNSKNGLNVRNKPSVVLGRLIDLLDNKEKVEIITTSGKWSKISYDEDRWVSSNFLKKD